jgi:hypothetical protein
MNYGWIGHLLTIVVLMFAIMWIVGLISLSILNYSKIITSFCERKNFDVYFFNKPQNRRILHWLLFIAFLAIFAFFTRFGSTLINLAKIIISGPQSTDAAISTLMWCIIISVLFISMIFCGLELFNRKHKDGKFSVFRLFILIFLMISLLLAFYSWFNGNKYCMTIVGLILMLVTNNEWIINQCCDWLLIFYNSIAGLGSKLGEKLSHFLTDFFNILKKIEFGKTFMKSRYFKFFEFFFKICNWKWKHIVFTGPKLMVLPMGISDNISSGQQSPVNTDEQPSANSNQTVVTGNNQGQSSNPQDPPNPRAIGQLNRMQPGAHLTHPLFSDGRISVYDKNRVFRFPDGRSMSGKEISKEVMEFSQLQGINWRNISDDTTNDSLALIRDSKMGERHHIPRRLFIDTASLYIYKHHMQGEMYFMAVIDKHLCESLTTLFGNIIDIQPDIDQWYQCDTQKCTVKETTMMIVPKYDQPLDEFISDLVFTDVRHASDAKLNQDLTSLVKFLRDNHYILNDDLKCNTYFDYLVNGAADFDVKLPDVSIVKADLKEFFKDKFRCGVITQSSLDSLLNYVNSMCDETHDKIIKKHTILTMIKRNKIGLPELRDDPHFRYRWNIEHTKRYVGPWYDAGHVHHNRTDWRKLHDELKIKDEIALDRIMRGINNNNNNNNNNNR